MAQRIIFPERGQVRLDSFEPSVPGAGEILVRAQYSLMSIGTETIILHARYERGTHFDRMFSFPQLRTGVQTVGVVEGAGRGVTDFQEGDPVYMRVAHTSHWTLPAEQCSEVPADIDRKQAGWCGLAKTAFRAAHAAPFAAGGNVLIVGAGPVGQMTLRWARALGMVKIAVVDMAPRRLEFAASGGATHCFAGPLAVQREALLAYSDRDGFDVVVDTTGNAAVFSAALGVVGTFGKLVLLGDTGYPSQQCLTSDVMSKGITIVATHDHHNRGGWTQRRVDARFFELVLQGAFHLDGLITHEFSPEDCVAAYALAEDQRDETMGVLFDWTTMK